MAGNRVSRDRGATGLAATCGENRELDAVNHADLAEYRRKVILYRTFGDRQITSNAFVTLTLGDQSRDLDFPWRQYRESTSASRCRVAWRRGNAIEQLRQQCPPNPKLIIQHCSYRFNQRFARRVQRANAADTGPKK